VTIQPEGTFIDLHDLHWLPGGTLLAGVHRKAGVDAIGVIKDGTVRAVLEATFIVRPAYSPTGHLIYERAPNAGLWAVPFSIERLDVAGEPFLIGDGTTPRSRATARWRFSASRNRRRVSCRGSRSMAGLGSGSPSRGTGSKASR
jgi:hypothetical protein